MPKKLQTIIGWLKYVNIKKLDNNRVGENINPKPNILKIVVRRR